MIIRVKYVNYRMKGTGDKQLLVCRHDFVRKRAWLLELRKQGESDDTMLSRRRDASLLYTQKTTELSGTHCFDYRWRIIELKVNGSRKQ